MNSALTLPRLMLLVSACLLPGMLHFTMEWGLIVPVQLLWCCSCCAFVEWLCNQWLKLHTAPLSNFSWLVTGMLLAKSLPPFTPAPYCLGAAFIAVGLVKYGAGGLGKNRLNPAMVALAVMALCFYQPLHQSGEMNASYIRTLPWQEVLLHFFSTSLPSLPDGMSSATPLTRGNSAGAYSWSWLSFAFGGLILARLKIIRLEIPVAILLSYVTFELLMGHSLWQACQRFGLGGLVFAAFFIATDPVTSPLSQLGRWIYGGLIGAIVSLARCNGLYPDGIAFAILAGNLITPHLDQWLWRWQNRQTA